MEYNSCVKFHLPWAHSLKTFVAHILLNDCTCPFILVIFIWCWWWISVYFFSMFTLFYSKNITILIFNVALAYFLFFLRRLAFVFSIFSNWNSGLSLFYNIAEESDLRVASLKSQFDQRVAQLERDLLEVRQSSMVPAAPTSTPEQLQQLQQLQQEKEKLAAENIELLTKVIWLEMFIFLFRFYVFFTQFQLYCYINFFIVVTFTFVFKIGSLIDVMIRKSNYFLHEAPSCGCTAWVSVLFILVKVQCQKDPCKLLV